jgi:hypothetical protein
MQLKKLFEKSGAELLIWVSGIYSKMLLYYAIQFKFLTDLQKFTGLNYNF